MEASIQASPEIDAELWVTDSYNASVNDCRGTHPRASRTPVFKFVTEFRKFDARILGSPGMEPVNTSAHTTLWTTGAMYVTPAALSGCRSTHR